ncbi:Oxoglutarate/iron-dependent dioxygenase [Sesbania bispinosa]|nr:Oxoglutarate/iron-dependent dioxygenase [Sesbania bispinosa]
MESISLPVPSVQEIVKEALTTVPERYVRPHHERPILSNTTPLPQVPVVDFSKLLSQDHKEPELKKLHYACKDWDDLETYSAEMRNLAIQILDLMANALRVDTMEIREVFGEGIQTMRINYYPPCPQPELVMGLNPHSDGSGLTILLQANEVEGLQIKKDGLWIPVKPLPNAFIVNIGDMLEMVTNGIYRSIEHRATVNSEKERLSIATFCSPSMEGSLGPAPSLVTPDNPAVFKRISVSEFRRGYLARELRGKSYLDSMRIKNENEQCS